MVQFRLFNSSIVTTCSNFNAQVATKGELLKNQIKALPLEGDFKGLCLAVLVSQVAVGFHAQCPAVLVSNSARNGRDVHAVFDAAGGKEVAQVVVSDSFCAGQLCGSVN